MFLISLNAEIVACILSFRKSRHKPNLESASKYGLSPDLGGKNGGVLSMRMQVILDSSFARPGSAPPIWGGKKGEFRDWTSLEVDSNAATLVALAYKDNHHNTSKIFRCSSQDPALITFKHSHLWNKMKPITVNQYNGNSFSATSGFYGGTVEIRSAQELLSPLTRSRRIHDSRIWY